jgi:GT2 family glycosyltransferase
MSVAAVVLSWNGRDDTLAAIRSLEGEPVETIVVDNASEDGSADAVAREFPGVELIRNDANLGYAGGMNVGIRRALERGAGHVFLLNNDVEVEPGAVERLLAEADGAGALCPVITSAEGVWYSGARFDPRRGYNGRHLTDVPSTVRETERACGAAMLIPREALEEVGLLDEGLFAYWEDAEWSLRARRAGLPIRVLPPARVRHKVSVTTGGEGSDTALYYSVRNLITITERYAPLGLLGTWRRRATILLAHAAQALLAGRPSRLRAVWRGFRSARRRAAGRPG